MNTILIILLILLVLGYFGGSRLPAGGENAWQIVLIILIVLLILKVL